MMVAVLYVMNDDSKCVNLLLSSQGQGMYYIENISSKAKSK